MSVKIIQSGGCIAEEKRTGQCTYYRKTDSWCAKLGRKCKYKGRKTDCRYVGTKKKPVFVK